MGNPEIRQRQIAIGREIKRAQAIKIDRMFAGLLIAQWILGIVFALCFSPYTYDGVARSLHPHLYFAVIGGGILALYPVFLVLKHPGTKASMYAITTSQLLFSSLFIHLTNGRIETHFHVFGSLAFLAAYHDVRILLYATVITALDHALRGVYIAQSVYGVLQASPWRAVEHSAWVIFEDIFLVFSIRSGNAVVGVVADKQANLEFTLANVESIVDERTHELQATQQTVLDQQQTLITSAKMSALGEMAGGIAHEINTPLGSIAMLASELELDAKAGVVDPAMVLDVSGDIKKTVDRIGSIVKALRTFARDSQHDELKPHSFKFIASETLNLCRERFASHGVKLIYDETAPDVSISCRPTEISQILLNLMNNSVDAIEMQDEKWIQLECKIAGAEILLSVSDSGPGIPEAVARKIMQPFFTTKEIGKGTGLGLSISRSIAEAHGGRLELDQTLQNTKFVLRLPNRNASTAAA